MIADAAALSIPAAPFRPSGWERATRRLVSSSEEPRL